MVVWLPTQHPLELLIIYQQPEFALHVQLQTVLFAQLLQLVWSAKLVMISTELELLVNNVFLEQTATLLNVFMMLHLFKLLKLLLILLIIQQCSS